MTQSSATSHLSNPLPDFSVIFGNKDEITNLVDTAWLFTYSTLWNNHEFSSLEKSEAKYYIKEWITGGKKPLKAFTNFCQRIILARQNIKSLNTDFLTLPSLWLDKENIEGYASTKELLERIKVIRHSLPNFQIEIKALAEAVLEFAEEPTKENFIYWRSYFIEKDEPVLLNIYSVFAANKTFNIQ
ncbi:hypothetical protein [Longitalea luteola]|uniref:hypothetical protein n=1 Tax=Longitalea luteola TaxID=2812563 RepID=UPI001A957402|nr:hypothetical protein [Longitalea luteola]